MNATVEIGKLSRLFQLLTLILDSMLMVLLLVKTLLIESTLYSLSTLWGASPNDLALQCRLIRDNINKFSNLREVFIEVPGGNKDVSRLDSLIDKFPKSVTTLAVEEMGASNGNDDIPFDDLISCSIGGGSYLKSNIQPCEHVKEFASTQYIFSPLSAQYLMRKFPNLTTIYVSRAWGILDKLSRLARLDFFKFISRIPRFQLVGDAKSDSLAYDLVNCFMEASSGTTPDTKYSDKMNLKIVYNRDSHEKDYADGSDGEEYLSNIVIRNCKAKYDIMNSAGDRDYDGWPIKTTTNKNATHIDLRFKETIKSSTAVGYYKEILKNHGSRISQLYFTPHSEQSPIMIYNGGDEYTMGAMTSCVNTIVESCANMHNLVLN